MTFGKQDRLPGSDTRARRNASKWRVPGIVALPGGGLAVDPATGALTIDTGSGIIITGNELTVALATNPGLEFISSALRVQVVTNGGIARVAGGLELTAATTAFRGGVLQQTLVTDQGILTDNSGGTSGGGTIAAVSVAIVDPADSPVDADALRDDLVANTLPSIATGLDDLRNAVATLAAYATSLEDKINAMLAAQKTAGQMSTT
jgi:hypothetical protein